MHPTPPSRGRRLFLRWSCALAPAFAARGLFAKALSLTPAQPEGPFYPDHLPLDTDNDLLLIDDAITPAVGEITHLSGRVLTASGAPLSNVLVEIWQVDSHGIYLHSQSPHRDRRDEHFQGYGRFLTGTKGTYRFRTIKPVPYTAGTRPRAPHIHVIVSRGERRLLTTQLYVKGHPLNRQDFIFRSIDPAARAAVVVEFRPIMDSPAQELAAHFDVVLGTTPEDVSEVAQGL